MGAQILLAPLTPAYRLIVSARASAYARGWLASVRAKLPVISVGNLTFGGTGKTPVVAALAAALVERGLRPAVLTRGYGRASKEQVVLIAPERMAGLLEAGDEPLELAARLPGVPIVIDGDRGAGAEKAAELGCEVLLLDDGYQHLQLQRDLNILLIDAGDPFGGHRLPPIGRLREPLSAARRADLILLTKLPGGFAGQVRAEAIEAVLAELTPAVPVLRSTLVPRGLRGGGELSGRAVWVLAGIGRPEGFVEVLETLGAEIAGRSFFPDHHPFTVAEIEEVERQAEAAGALVITTAKDAVRIEPGSDIAVLEVGVELEGGLGGLIDRIVEVCN